MNKKSIFSMIAALMIPLMATMILPVTAWSYGNPAKADDLLYEKFGPRADRVLIKLYTSQTAEWDTGLETGQIDVTDWPMDFTHYDRYTQAPWTDTVKVLGYGSEFGCYLFDLNNNNDQYLGNPPNPAYPNPIYPNPMSDEDLRKAVAYLSNRPKYVAFIGAATATALYTVVGPSSGKYSYPDIKPGGAREDLCYLYSPADANATLDAGGFPVGPDGWRYWDRNGNSVKDAGEDFNLKLICRVDDPNRDFAGSDLSIEMTRCRIPHTALHMPSGAARTQWMSNKNGHIYTAGWSLTVDPDFLILWNWDFYWHPGNCYNTAGCNDPDFNTASYGVMYANDQAEAVAYSHAAQLAYATHALSCPLWVATGFKAVKRAYTGTPGVPDVEDIYEGDYWNGFVNIPGYGIDNYWSFLNMYPEGHEYGGTGNNMTIRYGFKTQEIKTMNAIYAEWLWDNTVLDLIGYESLLVRDPYNLGQFMSNIVQQFTVGTYTHPAYGTCTKGSFTIRTDVQWSDGVQLTIDDAFFTFVEMDDILIGRGLPPPWWYSNVMNILSFSILDPFRFEVLLDVKSVFALGWIGSNRIMPKHIWKPIVTGGDPTTFAPDPNLINSGPWRLEEYVENSHVLLTANSPGKTVDNNLAGSAPITSEEGYFEYFENDQIGITITPMSGKYPKPMYVPIQVHVENRNMFHSMTVNISVWIDDYCTQRVPNPDPPPQECYIVMTHKSFKFYNVPFIPMTGWQLDTEVVPDTESLWDVVVEVNGTREGVDIFNWGWALYGIDLAEDIAGSSEYDVFRNDSLRLFSWPSPGFDFKVDIKDVARASGAFGAYPGHSKWSPVADITHDYKVDIKDLARISGKFGWHA